MAKALRYTGCWPALDVLKTYPNWVFATDEECEPDQDETTIKPEGQQSFISEETDYTAATATLASGACVDAIISIISGKIDAVDVWDGQDWWRVRCDFDQKKWTPFIETWLPERERRPSVSLSDTRLFPARIVSRLPSHEGPPWAFTVPLGSGPQAQPRKPWYRFW